jgi:UDP-N-acetylmuramoyl-L-alanyl-D-glutamate--2,6-diaminopimelate ligase
VERVTVLAAREVRATSRGLAFTLDWDGAYAVELPLIGEFNVDNVLTTLGVLRALGLAPTAALAALSGVSAPPGRMEAISAPGRALAIIDYAHTPDALAKALRAARVHCDGELHVVFGCGGDRDRGKRPMMASVAAELADQVVITDDNPRTESPAAIAAEVLGGIPAGVPVMVIHDRAEAIRSTLSRARAGDAVLIAGKGHEDYQLIGTERRIFSDQQVVRAVYAEAA